MHWMKGPLIYLLISLTLGVTNSYSQENINYNQEIERLRQEINSLKSEENPVILKRHLEIVEQDVSKLEEEVNKLKLLEGKLTNDLIWRAIERLTLIGSIAAVLITFISYLGIKRGFYEFLESKKVIDNLQEKALEPVVNQSLKSLTPYLTQYLVEYFKNNPPITAASVPQLESKESFEIQPIEYLVNKVRVIITFGDITRLTTNIIVSSDDTELRMAGGVAKRILEVGGQEILKNAKRLAPIELGEVAVTVAGALNAQFVFHPAVINIAESEYPNENIIRSAVKSCLNKVEQYNARSIAFPTIGAGTGGFSVQQSAEIIANVIYEFLQSARQIDMVYLVIFKAQQLQQQPNKFFDRIFLPESYE